MSAIQKPLLGCGLLTFQVGLYALRQEEGDTDLHRFHQECGGSAGYKWYCKKCGYVFGKGEQPAKGQVRDGKLATFTAQELAAFDAKATAGLAIRSFIPIPPELAVLTLNKWLVRPDVDKGNEVPESARRAFAVLHDVLAQKRMAGVCFVTMSHRTRPALLAAVNGVLVLFQLAYHGEIRWDDMATSEKEDHAEYSEQHFALMSQLVESMKEPAEVLATVENPRAGKLEALIQDKLAGAPVVEEAQPAPQAVPDLQVALLASVNAIKAKKEEAS